ncbi:MAG: hypothetical protein APF80_05075 [Alphaproteobacteria bacterium BRH_c36]|nr:MAG: hypothetical protein APF80_05075 [Alphaproteobacteria bacterium BRH_c36]
MDGEIRPSVAVDVTFDFQNAADFAVVKFAGRQSGPCRPARNSTRNSNAASYEICYLIIRP